jgi:hypothetical protein
MGEILEDFSIRDEEPKALHSNNRERKPEVLDPRFPNTKSFRTFAFPAMSAPWSALSAILCVEAVETMKKTCT